MKAFQLVSKEEKVGQTLPSTDGATHSPKGLDSLHARLRRLEQKIDNIEAGLSTARRDINRIDRKQYREAPSMNIPPENPIPALSGLYD